MFPFDTCILICEVRKTGQLERKMFEVYANCAPLVARYVLVLI